MNKLSVWNPNGKISGKFDIEKLEEDSDGLRIYFIDKNDDRSILEYKVTVCSYKNTDESFWINTLDEIIKLYGEAFITKNTFFKVAESSYSKEIEDGTYGTVSANNLFHLKIVAGNAIIDVISFGEPIFYSKSGIVPEAID